MSFNTVLTNVSFRNKNWNWRQTCYTVTLTFLIKNRFRSIQLLPLIQFSVARGLQHIPAGIGATKQTTIHIHITPTDNFTISNWRNPIHVFWVNSTKKGPAWIVDSNWGPSCWQEEANHHATKSTPPPQVISLIPSTQLSFFPSGRSGSSWVSRSQRSFRCWNSRTKGKTHNNRQGFFPFISTAETR